MSVASWRRSLAALLAAMLACSPVALGLLAAPASAKVHVTTAAAASSSAASSSAGSSAIDQLPGTTSPFSPGVPEGGVTTTSTPTVAAATTSNPNSGLSGHSAIFIAIGAIVVIGGIGFYIWYDARRNAPVRAGEAAFAASGRSGSKAPPKSRKLSPAERKRRKRGKAR
jgi:hypothetical protein